MIHNIMKRKNFFWQITQNHEANDIGIAMAVQYFLHKEILARSVKFDTKRLAPITEISVVNLLGKPSIK